MHLAHGVAGAGVTGGLNWLGGKLNPALRHSDTYGGAAFGLFSDAAGGAVAGARGGPLGAGIGAVSGMVIGDAARIYGNLRDIHRNTIGDDALHQQVSAHQSALLKAQSDNPKVGGDFERQMAARREAAARSRQAFDAHMAALDEKISASEGRDKARERAAAERNAARQREADAARWKRTPINSATGLPYDSGRTHSLEGRPPGTTGPRTTRPQTQTGTNGNHGTNATMPPTHMPTSPPPGRTSAWQGGNQFTGGDDTAVRSAAAALDALTASSGRLQTAFEGLAGRVDTLFRQTPTLNFTPSGQQGGWYPGRQS